MPPTLRVETVPVAAIDSARWDEMHALERHFSTASREAFEATVRRYTDMVLIRAAGTGNLLGMGGRHAFPGTFDGRAAWFITSGTTRFLPEVRGQSIVQRAGFALFLRVRARHPLTPIFLYYDTFSFRSYVMMARNFAVYWPRHDEVTPGPVRAFWAAAGPTLYGDQWDPTTGIARSAVRLHDHVAAVEPAMLTDPAVAEFVRLNPGYTEGDRLPVLVPMTLRNWLAVLRAAWRRRRGSSAG